MSSTTEKIKERLPIEEVVSTYIKLESSGKNLKAKCPFHNEKTPSFYVSPDRGTYYCFGCGAKGDIFTFIEEFEGLDFRGALKILAERAGVTIEAPDPKKTSERETQFAVIEEATKFFEKNLIENKEVIDYLKDRTLEDKTIKDFRLGYALDEWRSLHDHLYKKGFKPKEMVKAGLVLKQEKKDGFYDRFRGRIMFPLFDSSGRVIAFSGRIFTKKGESGDGGASEKQAKYVNSPETELFHKSKVLYGYDKAKAYLRKYDFAIFVEGQVDLLASHQAGYKNTLATSGTSLTRDHFKLVQRFTQNIVLALDADEAGISSSDKGTKEALSMGMDVKIAALPKGSDPADLIKEDVSKWKKAIKEASHIIDFYLKFLKEKDLDDRKYTKEITAKVLPFVASVENKIDQAHFIKKLSEEMGISEEVVYKELEKVDSTADNVEKTKDSNTTISSESKPRDFIEERIQGIILWQESTEESSIDTEKARSFLEDITGENVEKLSDSEKEDKIFEAEAFFAETEDLEEVLDELFENLYKDTLKDKMAGVMQKIKYAERDGNSEEAKNLLEEYQSILTKLIEIPRFKNKDDK